MKMYTKFSVVSPPILEKLLSILYQVKPKINEHGESPTNHCIHFQTLNWPLWMISSQLLFLRDLLTWSAGSNLTLIILHTTQTLITSSSAWMNSSLVLRCMDGRSQAIWRCVYFKKKLHESNFDACTCTFTNIACTFTNIVYQMVARVSWQLISPSWISQTNCRCC